MIENKISLKKAIFLFFFIILLVTSILIFIQYKNFKSILIKSYINKYSFYSLQIKDKFKNIFNKAFYDFKLHQDDDINKLYTFQLLWDKKTDINKISKVFNSDTKNGHYELFVIDKNYTIVKTTYKPDLGLNLGKYQPFKKVLDDVFNKQKDIDISPIYVDTVSMNLKKYYLILSQDKKHLLQLAYVKNIYNQLQKIYNFVKPATKDIKIYFLNNYTVYNIDLKHKVNKKMPVDELYKNSIKTLKRILDINSDYKTFYKKVINYFHKNSNLIIKFDNNELIVYTLLENVLEKQRGNKLIIENHYDITELNKKLYNLFIYMILIILVLVAVFIISYFIVIKKALNILINIINKMKKNKQCENENIQIKELDELRNSYNKLHTQLNKEIEKNKKLYEFNKRFILDTIHQIRTPLNVILLNFDLLKLEIEDKNLESIEEIEASITMITNALEDLSFIVSHKSIEYKPTNINISNIIKQRINYFKTIAKVNSKKFICDIDENIEFVINKIEFERIVDNNISNAIKYSDEEEIFIALKKEDNKIVLKFASYGEKIKNPNKVFEQNYREHNHKRGLGLGLNMVKNICEKYNIKYRVYYENEMNVFEYIFGSY